MSGMFYPEVMKEICYIAIEEGKDQSAQRLRKTELAKYVEYQNNF